MQSIKDFITDWIREFLIKCIEGNLSGMFGEVNRKVGEIAGEVGQTPENWNSGVFSMIRGLSETVIIPIAGMILTAVLCYELINLIVEKNNMHDIDTWIFFKWIFKTLIAVYLVTHTFDIVMAIFDVAQHVVQSSAGVISGNADLDVTTMLGSISDTLENMDIPELFMLAVETWIVKFTITAVSLCITVVLFGRMIEIYLYVSIGPIPFATMANREWGGIGQNYIKGLAALGFQGFFILVCVAIYTVLVQSISTASDIHFAVWSCAAYTLILCFSLFKTGSLSKSVFGAH